LRTEYLDLLFKMVAQHETTSEEVNALLRRVAADPEALMTPGLIGIIEALCNCKAIIVILECLCDWLTGKRVAVTAPQAG
jgi:polysaccharide pyruvyl transferase WcaK-like protein